MRYILYFQHLPGPYLSAEVGNNASPDGYLPVNIGVKIEWNVGRPGGLYYLTLSDPFISLDPGVYLSSTRGDGYAAYHLVGWVALGVGQRLYSVPTWVLDLTPDFVFPGSWKISRLIAGKSQENGSVAHDADNYTLR